MMKPTGRPRKITVTTDSETLEKYYGKRYDVLMNADNAMTCDEAYEVLIRDILSNKRLDTPLRYYHICALNVVYWGGND